MEGKNESISAMWNPDIWLPVGIGLFTFLLAYMGIHVTLYPPEGDARIRWALSFFAVAVVCCAFIAWQAVRSVNTQNDLQARLDKIQQNTQQPPTVNVPVTVNPPAANLPPGRADVRVDSRTSAYVSSNGQIQQNPLLVIGKPIMINIFYKNMGTVTADNAKGLGGIYLAPVESLGNEKLATSQFKEKMKQLAHTSGSTIPPGGDGKLWFTATSDRSMTADDWSKFAKGEQVFYQLDYVSWTDPTGSHYLQGCLVVQRPNSGSASDPVIWHSCADFSAHK